MKKEKLLALESLRGIAAISVAFFHFKIGSHFNNAFVSNSWLMVDFFFVLSGFVIALNYTDRIQSSNDFLVFQKKRFLRLFPLHFVMLIVFLCIEFAKYIVEIKFGIISANGGAFEDSDLPAFIANLLLLQNWVIPQLTFNYPSWSISAEFITYAVFGCIVLLTRGKLYLLTPMLIIGVLAFGLLLSCFGMHTDNVSGPLRCLYSFSIGAITFLLYRQLVNSHSIKNSTAPLGVLLVNILVVTFYGSKNFSYVELIPILFGFSILVVALSRKENAINRFLGQKWLVYLGTISYGIYMIHAFVWWVFNQILRFVFKFERVTASDGGVNFYVENVYLADLISILGISLVIILAHISYKHIEMKYN